ncbi:MAG: translocation/assembly module TamB domain-containing protein [Pseudomonadota bacterium]|nr:translocation/assembly module TamB domain-containing protein [Pseudomonadota bacterium]
MRWFKWALWALLAVVLIVVLLVTIVVTTESGTRFVLNMAQRAVPQLSIGSIKGKITQNLSLASVSYQDDAINFSAKSLNYELTDWSVSSLMLAVKRFQANGIDVHVPYQETTESSEPFQGFVSPVELSVESVDIQQVRVFIGSKEVPQPEKPTVQINQLTGGLQLVGDQFTFTDIDARLPQQRLQSTGELALTEQLPFALTNTVTHQDPSVTLVASGKVEGSLASIDIEQSSTLSGEGFAGSAKLKGNVALGDEIILDLHVDSDDFVVEASEDQLIRVEQFEASLQGPLSAYELRSSGRYRGLVEKPTDLSFYGTGSTEQFEARQFVLKNGESQLEGALALQWLSGIQAQGRLQLKSFNLAQFAPEYPSQISGTARFSADYQGEAIRVDVPSFAFDGQLKGQPFNLTGQLDATESTVNVPQFLLRAGDNRVQGQLRSTAQGDLSGQFEAVLNELGLFVPDAKGRVNSSIVVSGDMKSPVLSLKGQLDGLGYQLYALDSGSYQYQGQPLLASDQGEMRFEAKQLMVGDQAIKSVAVNFVGGTESQALDFKAVHEEAELSATLSGRFDAKAKRWSGELSQNRLTVNSVPATVELQAPMAVNVDLAQGQGETSRGCWRDEQSLVDACLDSSFDWQDEHYQLAMELNALSAQWLKPYLKKNVTLRGVLSGPLDMQYKAGDVLLNTQLKTQDGYLLWENAEDDWRYESSIEAFDIKASSTLQQLNSQVLLRLDPQNYVQLDLQAARSEAALSTSQHDIYQWLLDGQIKGLWSEAELLADMLPEVAEAKGVFTIDGKLQGPLDGLIIDLNVDNADGFFLPNRTGTKIENVSLKIAGAPNQADIRLNAQSGGGDLAITGQANYNLSDLSRWQFDGQVEGKSFEFIDVPELLLFASPKLKIEADEQGALITGDVTLETTTLTIEQLPASAKLSSDDVIIHREQDQESATQYPVVMNIRLRAPSGVQANALGFVGVAKGELTLRNDQSDQNELLAYGALTVDDGTYEVLGQVLTIRNSSVVFSGPISNPSLSIFATRTSLDGEVLAGVKITGTPKKLQTELYSEPPLSDAEILSYVTTGKGLDDDSGGLSSAQLVQAAILLGVDKAAAKFPGVISAVGIDRIQVNEAAESENSSVEIGKNLTESVYVGYDYGLFNRLGFWVLEYQLTRALSLESRYGDSQSIDLKYQFTVE